MDTIYKRLETLRLPGETKRDFSARIGIKPQQYNKYREGRAPSLEISLRISRATGASPVWILTGRGPRLGPAIYDPGGLGDGVGEAAPSSEQIETPADPRVRRLGLKSDKKKLTDQDRVELAGSYLKELESMSRYDVEQISDLIADLVKDPELRELILEHWRFYHFRKDKS